MNVLQPLPTTARPKTFQAQSLGAPAVSRQKNAIPPNTAPNTAPCASAVSQWLLRNSKANKTGIKATQIIHSTFHGGNATATSTPLNTASIKASNSLKIGFKKVSVIDRSPIGAPL